MLIVHLVFSSWFDKVKNRFHLFDVKSFVSLDLRTLGILTTPQPNGLAVPEATMLPVKSTSDVMGLMGIGLKNRSVGATAMNERSSRSHRFSFHF